MLETPEFLLAPISEEFPAGESLEYEGTYDAIREARREDDTTLPRGIWEIEPKRANWQRVRDLCTNALNTRSKDLQIGIWLLESGMALEGFAGVRSGLIMLHRLCDRFWEEMYPKIEEGNLEYRLLPIEWMNEKLFYRLKIILVTAPVGEESRPYSWSDLEVAQRLDNLVRKDQRVLKEAERDGVVTLAKFDGSMMLTPDAALHDLFDEVEGSIEALDLFHALLRERCGDEAPSLARFRKMLVEIGNMVESVLRSRGMAPESEGAPALNAGLAPASEGEPPEERDQPPASVARPPLEIRSRGDAYAILAVVADYLMKEEPHSPTPYLVKRAVSWGSKPLPELLQELMQGENDLEKIYLLLGINEA